MSHQKLPHIPAVSQIEDGNTKKALTAIKEIIEVREGRLGENSDNAVTFQDLVDLGLITKSQIPK
jgi:hypothetical protein